TACFAGGADGDITHFAAPASENLPIAQTLLSPTGVNASDWVWFDDALPSDAQSGADGGDAWNWTTSNPTPFSGSAAHQSAATAGSHQHYFDWVYSSPMNVSTGDVLFTYVYLDPNNMPAEVMLQWSDGSWEHRAYWGANNLNYGTDGTPGRHYMGPLPSAGKWVRLEVPASQVALEGSTVRGMAFTLFNGRATWDATGKSASSGTPTNPPVTNPPDDPTNPPDSGDTNSIPTNPPVTDTNNSAGDTGSGSGSTYVPASSNSVPGTIVSATNILSWLHSTIVDDTGLVMPKPGDYALHILTPTLLELKLINTAPANSTTPSQWNLVNNYQFVAPPTGAFAVTANGGSVGVQAVGFKRRPLYAPLAKFDLRVDNSIYLQLSSPLSDNQKIEVKNPNGSLWGTNMQFTATMDPLRYSPAIHVNQEGYMPGYSKKAMVGYFAGNLGEMAVPAVSFKIVDATNGSTVFQGALTPRPDSGWTYSPAPYQKVYEADFTSFNTPGQYRLVVPGLGASLPFYISDGIAMDFARAYALGLYEQRCGTSNSLPYTRFTHDICHNAPASVPLPASSYAFTWTTISNYAIQRNPDNPTQTAPSLTSPSASLFPFVNTGTVDVSGGHHDAGDYSKYTANVATIIHDLVFAVDAFPGVSQLDNLGIPESGDGIPDVLQEAKWEADYLAKLQDADGAFYFIVYPVDTEYESDVTPDHGHPQVVWPKNSTATASAVAALAQCASSPMMKKYYPEAAAGYLAKAKLGWQCLQNAIAKYGKNGIYQRITFYSDNFADQDELAWAACEMFLATGDQSIHSTLKSWFPDPTASSTFRWGWQRMSECYGNAVRDYAFAARTGRLPESQLDSAYLAKCVMTITNAGDDAMNWSKQSAYGTSFPFATKAVQGAGWYFSSAEAFDITVAYQLNPKPDYMAAIIANMNYEGGCNPVNASYISGLGWKQQRDIVSQYALNDRRISPPSGMPIGNVQSGFGYSSRYGNALAGLCFPKDGGAGQYPFYDRWADNWNVQDEMVCPDSTRSLASLAFIAAQTSLKNQAWKSPQAKITVTPVPGSSDGSVTFSLSAPGMDLSGARITWETRDADPAMGATATFVPRANDSQWVEAEAQFPDGRRVFAATNFTPTNVGNVVWIDDTLPAGAQQAGSGGDSYYWTWVNANPAPNTGIMAHQSGLASGTHTHLIHDATATMNVPTGAVLYTYIYLDPANPPSEAMLQWCDGSSWEHRAYWGANNIASGGKDGTASQLNMGSLPTPGKWVRLEVPAAKVGLEGKSVNGMMFSLSGGRATWDTTGLIDTNIVVIPG
ncbi:MAG TPA: glycoside hydrolase family 9 protein, partial [Verrucomicrobiae bacterium]|nr:glycoside hydrolase family 9 protein [Verrucomicrobiae bacterium]